MKWMRAAHYSVLIKGNRNASWKIYFPLMAFKLMRCKTFITNIVIILFINSCECNNLCKCVSDDE